MKHLNKLFRWFESKRTMTYKGQAFLDHISGRMVNYYEDKFGDTYMANQKYGFRVLKNK